MSLSPSGLLETMQPWRGCQRWLIGLSGGLDSTVLLHLLSQLRGQVPLLLAVHVNHQLSPDADQWSTHCRQLCEQLQVELEIHTVQVQVDNQGPEAAARNARYRVFEQLVKRGDVLLLAHHLDDQVETFFLRALRGAGTRGLSAMPAQRSIAEGELFRPLLAFGRKELEQYAGDQHLQWVLDDSNTDTSLDRNYLRQEVLPLLEQRWPGYRRSVLRGRDSVREADSLLQSYSSDQLKGATGEHFGEQTLDLSVLDGAETGALALAVRLWLQRLGLARPGGDQLREFIQQLTDSGPNARPLLQTSHYLLRRFQQKLYVSPVFPGEVLMAGQALAPGAALTIPGLGQLILEPAQGQGIRASCCESLEIGYRHGGERAQPSGRAHSQSLKKLLQEYGVPPWWRDRLPLLVAGEDLVAVADLWVCEGFQAGADEEGYILRWKRNSVQLAD